MHEFIGEKDVSQSCQSAFYAEFFSDTSSVLMASLHELRLFLARHRKVETASLKKNQRWAFHQYLFFRGHVHSPRDFSKEKRLPRQNSGFYIHLFRCARLQSVQRPTDTLTEVILLRMVHRFSPTTFPDWPMNSEPPLPSIDGLTTEAINPASEHIDTLSALDIVRLMNAEDATIPQAIAAEAEHIAAAILIITDRIQQGGRLVYIGAGTSGRLGVLDASECPPTFSTPPTMVVGLIAGGESALRTPAEGVEDHPEVAVADLQRVALNSRDVLVGIATSGRTPYVIGALKYADSVKAFTIGLACNANSEMSHMADLMITPIVGPEIISGSTRMKAGTATKMVLNMLTTGTMVQLGKTYGNLMVDLRATNAKLMARSRRLVTRLTGVTEERAEQELSLCGGDLKTAVVAIIHEVTPDAARTVLKKHNQHLRLAIQPTLEGENS